MSVLVYCDHQLAADSQVTREDDTTMFVPGLKVHRYPKHGRYATINGETILPEIFGVVGDLGHSLALVEWVRGGCEGEMPLSENDEACAILVIVTSEKVLEFVNSPHPLKINKRHDLRLAWGAGASLAIGAMSVNPHVTAELAAEIACRHSIYCGGKVEVVTCTA